MVLDESKNHTIRDLRKGQSRHAVTDDPMMLYFGMRTKWCRKLGDAKCIETLPIIIYEASIYVGSKRLSFDNMELLSWRDGFRPEGSSFENPEGSFELMIRYWKLNGGLSYERAIIYWKDFIAAPTKPIIEKIKS